MKVSVKKLEKLFHLEATSESGKSFYMDASEEVGGTNSGMRPLEALLAALGGCSSIDVILILNKQKQEITSFEVEVESDKEKVDSYSLFKKIVVHYKISGNVDESKVHRAIQLSLDKYCSVSKMLEPIANITYKLSLNGR